MRCKLLFGCALVGSAILLSTASAFPESLDGIPASIRSPRELVNWLEREFTYELKFPDSKQTPEETLHSRRGDCEDFAAISKIVLARLNIPSDVIVINFRQLGISHAVCIFKTGETYALVSNKDLIFTKGRTMAEAIDEMFPDWERILVVDPDGGYKDVVERRYASVGRKADIYNLAAPLVSADILGPEFRDMGLVKLFLRRQLIELSNVGMSVNVGTFITILKDRQVRETSQAETRRISFIFDKIALTSKGFRIPCIAYDGMIARRYYAVFSLHRDDGGGFSVSVYSEKERRNIKNTPGEYAVPSIDKHGIIDKALPIAEAKGESPASLSQ